MHDVPRYNALTIYRRLLGLARPYWVHIGAIFVLHMLTTPLKLLLPVPLKIAVDSVVGEEALPGFLQPIVPAAVVESGTGLLLFTVALLVVIAILINANDLCRWLLNNFTGQQLTLLFRSVLFRHVQRLSLTYHDTRGTTDATYRIQNDAPAIRWVAVDGVIPFIGSGVTLVAMVTMIALLDWQLALVALAIVPVLFLITQVWGEKLRTQWRDVMKLHSSAMSLIQQTMGSLRVVKAFSQEDREHERFVGKAGEGVRGELRVARSQASFDVAINLTLTVGTAATLFLGIRHVQAGVITLGEMLLIWMYLSQLYGPLQQISLKIATLQGSMASAERAFALLDESPDVAERPDARPLARCRGGVSFRDVGFGYERERPVLGGVSFDVRPDTRVGIVGHTGAGKSTLMNLLARFYDPTEGCILLDGEDVRAYRVGDLRRQFAMVLQEPVLFDASIAENIAYARPEATREEIVEAAKGARAHGFIEALPEGYETSVGERGLKLSGGERQRISLARAFLKDAPILILDEPTSSVDSGTEAMILEATQRLMEGRTTFMIAHRLSTLRTCDVLLILDGGRLVDVTTDVERKLGELESPASFALTA